MSYRLAIDVGGTFTDLLLFDDKRGNLVLTKTPSTPSDPSVGVLTGIRKIAAIAGIDANQISHILHGTTVATNTVLEEKGARVGLITTRGFEQMLHVARGQTPGPLAGWIIMRKPEPMAPLGLTRGISARMTARGQVQTPVDPEEVHNYLKELRSAGIEALTVSLLNAYANPEHEHTVKRLAKEVDPELPVTISTEILPEFREYERTLTTVMNSYLRPKMRLYLHGMQQKLAEAKLASPMQIIRSDGGVMSLNAAAEHPVNTLLSGPSGGAVAAAYIGELAGFEHVLSFDMGGTSTDVAITRENKATVIRETHVGQYPVKVPSVDVRTVGAGGGSIAHVPITGALRVGPQSAGAVPGPACYDTGGTEPTVSDANLVLGYLPTQLLGGEMRLSRSRAEQAVQKIADALALPVPAAAEGIYNIVNENMFGALRLVSIQRGFDPRDFALVALGGAGPLHTNALSILCGSWPSIVPPTPGVLSALGFLHSDIKTEFSRTVIRTLEQIDARDILTGLQGLGEQATEWLRSEGIPASNRKVRYQIDMRYYRQGYEFPVDVELDWFTGSKAIDRMTNLFKEVHQRNYSFNIDHVIEVVNLRATAIGIVPKIELKRHRSTQKQNRKGVTGRETIFYKGKNRTATVWDRGQLGAGNVIPGPAIITQSDSTTLILPDHHGVVDAYLNVLIWPNGHKRQAATHGHERNGHHSRN